MARKRPDPRVTRYAVPPLARLRGKPANAELRISMALATCTIADCENEPLTSKTTDGIIEYRCKEHLLTATAPTPTPTPTEPEPKHRTLRESGFWAYQ